MAEWPVGGAPLMAQSGRRACETECPCNDPSRLKLVVARLEHVPFLPPVGGAKLRGVAVGCHDLGVDERLDGFGDELDAAADEGDVDAAKEVAGTYLNNRRQFYGVPALFGLGSETKVTADDGFVVLGSGNRYAPLVNDV
ncbi:MAG: hypothetical protein AAF961_14280, partial [Planctomycetota bacterium]